MVLRLLEILMVACLFISAAWRASITNGWQKFRHITVPLVSPVTFYILITSLIGGFQVFVEVQVMTNKGGTNYSAATVVYYLYDKAFSNGQLGYGCALAVILAIIIFIITALNFAGQDRWVKTMD